MKRVTWQCAVICAFAFLGMSGSALGSRPGLPSLTEAANVICVAKITNVKSLDRIKIEAGYRGRDGKPLPIDAQNAIADIEVESMLKGKTEQISLQVTFFKNVYIHDNPTPFTELNSGEYEILFLTTTENKLHFALTEPASHGRSKISLGEFVPKKSLQLTPLRTVLAALSNATESSSKSVKLDCLKQLSSIGFLLYLSKTPSGLDYDQVPATQLLKKLQEPVEPSLEEFVKYQIWPTLTKLTKDPDVDLSEQAYITSGSLQDVTVIPKLAQIAEEKYSPNEIGLAAGIIGDYRNKDAVYPLIQTLNSTNYHVREQAIYSLRELNNPVALPFIIERIDDANASVILAVDRALFTLTGELPSAVPAGDNQSSEARDIAFWKKWATDHGDKLKALRAQFTAVSIVTPDP